MAFMNKWEIALEDKIEELKECQSSKGLNSCLSCKEINNCTLRDFYLTAVYESMNQGESGGFEF
ncbi:MAG: hypothetical protein JJV88_03455 [Sulfurovum sp.]|nr:hypothetical protein [Sulfurovaceae bacterium]